MIWAHPDVQAISQALTLLRTMRRHGTHLTQISVAKMFSPTEAEYLLALHAQPASDIIRK